MNEGSHIDSELLARYLSGEAGADEQGFVERWVAGSPSNARELERMRTLWDLGAKGIALADVNVDDAWSRLSDRIAEAVGRGRVVPIHRRTPLRWLAAAAVLTGLFFGVRYLFNAPTQELMTTTEHLRSTLADGSSVILSPGSSLNAQIQNDRRITLSGEAYFEVERDVQRPFIVGTGDVTVTVLGTGFEVSAYDTSSSVLVRVRHGRVRVVADGDSLVLQAGGYARYNRAGHILERLSAPTTEVWGDRIIQFEQAPMTDVAAQLEGIFGIRIDLGNERIGNCMLTASFEDEPIDYILRVIADTYGLSLTQQTPKHYVLDGEGC